MRLMDLMGSAGQVRIDNLAGAQSGKVGARKDKTGRNARSLSYFRSLSFFVIA